MVRILSRAPILAWLVMTTSGLVVQGGEVVGRVAMPDTCSPSASPAVVTLEPKGGAKALGLPTVPASVALVNQRGLQFEPRVQVVRVGQTIRFGNQDAETHSVHVLTPGFAFNRSMKPNVPEDFTPDKPGVIRLACDIHSHMKGFVVATLAPWAKVVKGGDAFRFPDVPDGSYTLRAWHEMGEPFARDVEVSGGEAVDLGTLALKGLPIAATAGAVAGEPILWSDVTDRIGVLLAEARAVVRKPGGVARGRKLAEDAYFGEFELSDMETAVRRHLGAKRASTIEGQFLGLRAAIKEVGEGKADAARLVDLSRELLIDLAHASDDLNRLGVRDRRGVGLAASAPTEPVVAANRTEQGRQLAALAASFEAIRALADSDRASEASSAMADAYFADFEPLERHLVARRPREVAPLEARFGSIRGGIDSGLKGPDLADRLDGLRAEVASALARADAMAAGSFGAAFGASLVTILREGVEVILLLAMLVALVAKAGQPGSMAAVRWGVGVAVLASALTALVLNLMVGSTQGRTREIVEGAVMMTAAGVLFYVSYWLISQTQARRWAEFLKGQVVRGSEVGGFGTLAVTAFLAVYREGAETALMYQAMISGQGGSRDGLIGLAAGLALGLALLGAVALVIRRTSVKLPLRPFFKVTGLVLFAMAVVFAGNGVFELQGAGIIKVTPVGWLGLGLPALGLHPSTQALSVQGILIAGALLAFFVPAFDGRPSKPVRAAGRSSAGVGARA